MGTIWSSFCTLVNLATTLNEYMILSFLTLIKYQGAIMIPSFRYPEVNLPSRRRIKAKLIFTAVIFILLMTSNQVQNVISFPQGHQLVYACYVAGSGIKVLRENSIL